MNHSSNSHIVLRRPCLLVITVLLFVAFGLPTVQAAGPTEPSGLQQFTASGHILGFEPGGLYVAAGDHMLRVAFTGTPGVAPNAGQTPDKDGKAQPLARVTYTHLWPGVTLSYLPVPGGIVQSTYLLEPGADAGRIRLRYNASVEIEAEGSLRIDYETGQLRESAPIAWQEINGQRIAVDVTFSLLDSSVQSPHPPEDWPARSHIHTSTVGFCLGRYNPDYPLTIDPTLQWNTFMGSSDEDIGWGIAVDESGNVYVAGESSATWGSPVNAHAGDYDAFAAKLDSSGALVWNTFMGSADADGGWGVAVDGSGDVYVSGSSYATWGSPVNAHAGNTDAFAAKLNSNGFLLWNTFMGSAAYDDGYGIAVNESGNVYVAGRSPVTWGSPVNAHTGYIDAFAVKLDSGGGLVWNTFMGSSDEDIGWGIAVDGNGNVYVTGYSWATWGAPVNAHAGNRDAFAAKLNSSGALVWNTFMGSSDADGGWGIAVDRSGNAYVSGFSGATWGSPVNAHAGNYDAFAAKLNSGGVLVWNTFMGSASTDFGHGIAVDGSENAYVAGRSYETWGSPVDAHAGDYDAFAVKLNSSGALVWNTFMGSADVDMGYAIAVDEHGNVHVAGEGGATWGSPVNAHAGNYDAFAAKLVPPVGPVPTISEWGMILFFILLVGPAVWAIRRRTMYESVKGISG